jgi:hypothetical protein
MWAVLSRTCNSVLDTQWQGVQLCLCTSSTSYVTILGAKVMLIKQAEPCTTLTFCKKLDRLLPVVDLLVSRMHLQQQQQQQQQQKAFATAGTPAAKSAAAGAA